MPITWPPAIHDDVSAQAYGAAGGDYFRSGHFYTGVFHGATTSVNPVLTRLYARPFWVPVPSAFDRIAVNVSTAATAASGGVVRMGVYSTTAGMPGALLAEGSLSSESTGSKEVTISLTLDPGIYWVAMASQVSVCSVTGHTSSTVGTPFVSDSTAAPTSATAAFYVVAAGALPDPYGTPSGTFTTPPLLALRAA
jgi:hypothetical protein